MLDRKVHLNESTFDRKVHLTERRLIESREGHLTENLIMYFMRNNTQTGLVVIMSSAPRCQAPCVRKISKISGGVEHIYIKKNKELKRSK
jgi:hypothetical protein